MVRCAHLLIGGHVAPKRRGRLGADLTTVLDSDQAKVAFVVAAGVQLAVLTEQEANTGSADLRIGGSQVRVAVSYHCRQPISEGEAEGLVDRVVAHIWECAIVPGVRGCEREHKGAVEHRTSPGAWKTLVRLGARQLRGLAAAWAGARQEARRCVYGQVYGETAEARTGGRRLGHEDQAL